MADDVEAELEAPEALEIAKEDILLSKMEEERERYEVLLLLPLSLSSSSYHGVVGAMLMCCVVDKSFRTLFASVTFNDCCKRSANLPSISRTFTNRSQKSTAREETHGFSATTVCCTCPTCVHLAINGFCTAALIPHVFPPTQLIPIRVNEEMKVAAAKYMEEQERVKADKEEKMTKFRDSAADAAARTIQQMYYVFSVS